MKAKVLAAALTVVVSGSVYARGGDDNSLRNIGSNVSSVTQVGVVNFNIGAQSLGRLELGRGAEVERGGEVELEVRTTVDAPRNDPYLDLSDLREINMVASSIYGDVSLTEAVAAVDLDDDVNINSRNDLAINSNNTRNDVEISAEIDIDTRITQIASRGGENELEFDNEFIDEDLLTINVGGGLY
jgi:hypothetical protein